MESVFILNIPFVEGYDQCFIDTVMDHYLDWFRHVAFYEKLYVDDESEEFERTIDFIEDVIAQIPDRSRYLSGEYTYSYIVPGRHTVKVGFITEIVS